eukprot:CAMPEP_0204244510 /NCGR_PEP_ID=MMETSP0361-20130328/97060_1 /ASSEMBLY_ACC=CAM_ASM_000343 /TAXON_ID=268821 /ORGANISM="Scrippsiella Hangoei, Strain SHTV-5" /LENGTH=66 /DNA_ID=CAMNT_0051217555 /DNA_START=75 /DNA_END=271 /DNA_ORIENTATION=-
MSRSGLFAAAGCVTLLAAPAFIAPSVGTSAALRGSPAQAAPAPLASSGSFLTTACGAAVAGAAAAA